MRKKLFSSSLVRNFAATAGVQIFVALLSLVSGPLLARGLGPDGRGQLAVVLTLGQLVAFLSDAGALGYLIRERAHGRHRGELIGSSLPIIMASFVLWALVAWPLAQFFGKGVPVLTNLILIQLTLLPFTACTQIGSGIALGEERWRVMVAIRLTAAVVPVLGISVLFFTSLVDLKYVYACYFVATVIASTPAIYIFVQSRPFKFNRKVMIDTWRFGRTSLITTIVTVGNARADVLIVSQYLTLHDVGIYVVGSTLAAMPLMLANASGQSLSRRLALNNLGPETARASRILTWSIAGICVVVACAAPIVVPWLFGSQFRDSVPVVLVLLFGTVCASPSNFLGYATSLAGQPKNAAIAQFIGIALALRAPHMDSVLVASESCYFDDR